MEFPIKFNEENYQTIAKKLKILGNPNHLKILLILKKAEKSMKRDEIHKILEKENIYSHRENTYKALQKLTKLNIIKKGKGKNRIGDIYFLD